MKQKSTHEKPRVLVLVNPASLRPEQSGATFRLATILRQLESLPVAYSIADDWREIENVEDVHLVVGMSWPSLYGLMHFRRRGCLIWFDACDSALKLRGSRIGQGEIKQALALIRDMLLSRIVRFSLVTYISENDMRADRSLWAVKRTVTEVLEIDWPRFTPLPASGPRRIVFCGDGNYPPNREAAEWIGEQLSVHLQELGVSEQVFIYGRGFPSNIERENVRVMGYVSEPEELYREGDIHIAPMSAGAGVKSKVAVPLNSGIDVLATPSGAQGFRANERLHVAAREGFASELVFLLAKCPAKSSKSTVLGDNSSNLEHRLMSLMQRPPVDDSRL